MAHSRRVRSQRRRLFVTASEKICKTEIKDKSAAMIAHSLGDTSFRNCNTQIAYPLKMVELPDQRYASTREASRISTFTAVFSRQYQSKQDMGKYGDEFETLFAHLKRLRQDIAFPEIHKAPLLLICMSTESPLKRQ